MKVIEKLLVEEVDKYAVTYGGNVSPEFKTDARKRILVRKATRKQAVAESKKKVRIHWAIEVGVILLIMVFVAYFYCL